VTGDAKDLTLNANRLLRHHFRALKPDCFSHTAEAATVRAVLDECRRQGGDEAAILAASDLESSDLQDSERHIPGASVRNAWATALTLTGDPLLGLHAAEHLPFGEFGVPDFVAANAPTGREGLARLCRYFRIITGGGTLSLEARGGDVLLRYDDRHDAGPATLHVVDFTFACVVVRFRFAFRGEFAPREVWFHRDGSTETELDEYARVFGAPIRFDAPFDALVFDPATLDRPMPGASLHLSAILEKVGDEQLAKLPGVGHETSQAVRQLLDDGFNTGDDLPMSDVAGRMGMSQRTLQRRLGDEDSSFKELREQVRHDLACIWLRQPQMAISEVAFLLGFSEPSAFHRAFKRWAGQTPAGFRKVQLSGA